MNPALYHDRKRLHAQLLRPIWLIMTCALIWGCGLKRGIQAPSPSDLSWTERPIAAGELQGFSEQDPKLTGEACMEILARLNHKDRTYIQRDIKEGKALKVPNDFRSYQGWTPLPVQLKEAADVRHFILVVKDIAFLGWYEHGVLLSDTHVCIGKKRKWTRSGRYKVLAKDRDHISSSYRSALGYPALMPFALRIYGRVWIHGGDVIGANCSHGCINLPLDAAEQLYSWAGVGAAVLIVESIEDLHREIEKPS